MRRSILLKGISLLLGLVVGLAGAEEDFDFTDETTRINYSLGHQIGGDFKRQGIEMNADALVQGIQDALAGGEPVMSREAVDKTLAELKREIMAEQRNRHKQRAEKMRRAGLEFLEQNKAKDGVKTTASGLQYKVIAPGSGKSPGLENTVTVNYRGTLISGQVFDSSYKRGKPATFRLDQVIEGWAEGLQLMQKGAKYELYIPPDLAYDKRGPLADQTLIFEVELIEVNASGTKHGG